MADPGSAPRLIRFGVFEVDLRSGELCEQGLNIRLQEQPFQVLVTLLEHAGELLTCEELQKSLWPADTFVDFDNSLNTAINKIREALGDSAENLRLVETLPRRGYRFICPVESLAPGPSPRGEGDPQGRVRGLERWCRHRRRGCRRHESGGSWCCRFLLALASANPGTRPGSSSHWEQRPRRLSGESSLPVGALSLGWSDT